MSLKNISIMKTIYKICALIAFFAIMSCDNNAIDIEDLSRFRQVYIVQAGEGTIRYTLDITDSIQIIKLSAGWGGDTRPETDVSITMQVMPELLSEFNEINNTAYQIVPSGAYEIEQYQVVLQKGKSTSSPLTIKFKTKDFIEPGTSYLLPIGMVDVDADVPLNDKLKTAYILITGTYPLGEEPPAKVWELKGRPFKYLFTIQGALGGTASDILDVYEYDNLAGVFKNDPVPGLPTGGFGVFDLVIAHPGGLIARDNNGVYSGVPGAIFEYPLNVEARTLSGLGVTGTGFNAYNRLTFSIKQNAMYGRMGNGDLEVIRKVNTTWSNKTAAGSGYDRYTIIEAYQDGLLAMEPNGVLWYIDIDEGGQFDEPRQVGNGWNQYSTLIANGDKLLALDFTGNVWQYNFDLRGVWNVGL
jgi:hypothetical protein